MAITLMSSQYTGWLLEINIGMTVLLLASGNGALAKVTVEPLLGY